MKKTLACLLAALLLLGAAQAREEACVSLASSLDSSSYSISFHYSDDWFLESAYAYQHELCRASLGMAIAAFRDSEQNPDGAIRAFFSDLGFSAVQSEEYAVKQPDTIGSAMAHRIIGEGDGAISLVAVAISGGNYELEWIGNFDTGNGDTHKGFSEAAQKVVRRVKNYIEQNQLQNPRVWLSGYSRSAAVANLAAAYLAEGGLLSDEQIFAYTFATPRTVMGEKAGTHPNIFNVVNAADLVTEVPLKSWGYRWYGRTLYLPSSMAQGIDYPALLSAFASAYEKIAGSAPLHLDDSELISLLQKAVKGLSVSASSQDRYTQVYQALINKLFLGETFTKADEILFMMLSINIANAIAPEGSELMTIASDPDQVMAALGRLSPVLTQHMPEVYAAWLFAIQEDALLQNSLTLTESPVI
ncbi:MAG: lipase family protein [Clostridiales bacterium]|nr:lipase family protein [Clostridiales bacterium]